MIQINLLPRRSQKRKVTVRQILLGYLLCLGTAVIVMVGLWVYQRSEISELNERLARVNEEVRQLAKYEAMLAEVTKKKEIIDKKCQIIADLQRDRDTLARLMALISAEVPAEKIWLEKLVQSASSMTLNGVALSNESIAEFMRNLESSPYIVKGTVNLTHSRQTLISNLKLREFQITYQYVPYSQVQKLHNREGT